MVPLLGIRLQGEEPIVSQDIELVTKGVSVNRVEHSSVEHDRGFIVGQAGRNIDRTSSFFRFLLYEDAYQHLLARADYPDYRRSITSEIQIYKKTNFVFS